MLKKRVVAYLATLLYACGPEYIPPPDLPSSVTKISTPREAQRWLEEVLHYEHDDQIYGVKDFWAPCALTYKNRAGDCDDYAICAAALLQEDVEQGFFITITNYSSSGHAAFVYRLDGKWGVISNIKSEYREPQFSSLSEAVQSSFNRKYTNYSIYSYSNVDIVNGAENLEDKFTLLGQFLL